MALAPDCNAVVDLCAMRVAGLTTTGIPTAGSHGYFTTAITQAKIGTVGASTTEILRRNGCGTIVTYIPAVTSTKGSAISVDLIEWERDLIALLCGGLPMVTGGHTAGYRAPFLADGPPLPVCIELWAKAWNGTTQAVTATSTPNPSYNHYVMPFVQCDLTSQFTLADGDTVFTVTGVGGENPNITADGPWNDWPAFVAGHGGFTSSFGEYDDHTIPTGACGLQVVPATS